jgi:hypothetical protein
MACHGVVPPGFARWPLHGAIRRGENMKNFSACLKPTRSGFAFAESGEMPPGGDNSRVRAEFAPRMHAPMGLRMSEAKGRRQIALGLGSSLPPAVMAYVISACRRMDADLMVLCTCADTASMLLEPYRKALEVAAIVEVGSNQERALVRHLSANSRVLFVVSSGDDDPVRSLIGNGRRGLGAPVPIVVVASEQSS